MNLDRRTVLRGAGALIGLPLLEAMQAGPAWSAQSQAPLRLAFLYVPNGMHMPDWTPSTAGRGFELPATMQPLAGVRKHISVLTNLTLDGARAHGDGGGDHARSAAAFLTGAHPKKTGGADIHNGISVDQVIASHVGDQTRFASLELGLEGSSQSGSCDSGYSCAYSSNLAWRNSTSPLAKEMDPRAVFDRLFGSDNPAEQSRSQSVRQNRRKSVLDFAAEDARTLHAKLGAADRRKLDEYLYAVRDIEKRLDEPQSLDPGDYTRPAGVPGKLDEHCRLMLDMLALALSTDSTRVATFMFANEGSNRSHPELGAPESHHDLSHHGNNTEKQAKISKINHFYVQKLGYLLEAMDKIQEGERSLLENSIVLYGSGISDGDRHNHDNLPILLAGSGGMRIKPGLHHQFNNQTPLCNLYLWMARQFGVRTSSFGDSNDILDI